MTNICKVDGCNGLVMCKEFCQKHYYRFRKNGDPNKVLSEPNKKIAFEIDENGCFNCTSHSTNSGGYPEIQRKGKHIVLSRFIYMEMFGKIPDGHVIRHKCDNRRCINPEHLISGTPRENSRDMVERDRSMYGSRSKSAKLTEEQVLEIKRLLRDTTLTKREIAKGYSVARTTVTAINRGETWKHVKL